ncbi:MAG: outer membrane beta-barrel protein [Cyanobacteria bacterium]|jgi:opacity protein-like surface antigen|nr:outer membrane beta-barrel protein [Cyanobacteria bacterium GSL.Bin21]
MTDCKALLATATVATVFLLTTESAAAQAAYGSYIGVGVGYSPTEDTNDEGNQLGGVVSVRYKFLEKPLSLRVQGLIGAGTAVVPTVSYDFPLNWQTDAYVGAGLSFASGESPSPVGDQTSFAIQPGVDFMIPDSNTVLFGNAIVAFDAYRQGSGTAFSLQGGVGLQF